MNQSPFFTSEKFIKFIESEFVVVDEIKRYHKLYYEIETPMRNFLSVAIQSKSDVFENIIQSNFEYLCDISKLEECNDFAMKINPTKYLSHSIVLAEKK